MGYIESTWDSENDAALKKAVKLYGSDWIAIADYLGDRTSNQCLNRWEKSLNPSIKRGKWSQKEDELLIASVKRHGLSNWKRVKMDVPGRTDSQCRERKALAKWKMKIL